jgi:ATP-dependent DNA helicase RecG
MKKVYDFIKKECSAGRQCMIVFPLVEESEKLDLVAAIEAHVVLSKSVFSNLEVGLVHGRMKSEEKDFVIDRFAKNKINILVSTTVIEVGIDIPNATVMLIENAERFGLTQLHQLRGRVGRGTYQSYCILVRRNITDTSRKRLKILEETNNGFKVADEDLRLRGPGEFFGIRQSGFFQFKIANLITDGDIIQTARGIAISLIERDPFLEQEKNNLIKKVFFKTYSSKLEDLRIS